MKTEREQEPAAAWEPQKSTMEEKIDATAGAWLHTEALDVVYDPESSGDGDPVLIIVAPGGLRVKVNGLVVATAYPKARKP